VRAEYRSDLLGPGRWKRARNRTVRPQADGASFAGRSMGGELLLSGCGTSGPRWPRFEHRRGPNGRELASGAAWHHLRKNTRGCRSARGSQRGGGGGGGGGGGARPGRSRLLRHAAAAGDSAPPRTPPRPSRSEGIAHFYKLTVRAHHGPDFLDNSASTCSSAESDFPPRVLWPTVAVDECP